MTGGVTWEQLAWVAGLISAAGTVVVGFLFFLWRIVSSVRRDSDIKVAAIDAKATVIETELREYKQHVGETFATKDGVTTAIGRVEASVTRIGDQMEGSFERLSGRIDRLLEMRNEPPRRSRGPQG